MWTTIIDIVLKIAGYFLQKNADNEKAQKLFIDFIERVNKTYGESARLRSDYLDQIKRLTKELDK